MFKILIYDYNIFNHLNSKIGYGCGWHPHGWMGHWRRRNLQESEENEELKKVDPVDAAQPDMSKVPKLSAEAAAILTDATEKLVDVPPTDKENKEANEKDISLLYAPGYHPGYHPPSWFWVCHPGKSKSPRNSMV